MEWRCPVCNDENSYDYDHDDYIRECEIIFELENIRHLLTHLVAGDMQQHREPLAKRGRIITYPVGEEALEK